MSEFQPVVLSDAAVQYIAGLRDQAGHTMPLRLSVHSGGCSGFMPQMEFDDTAEDGDIIANFPASDGSLVTLVVDPQSVVALASGRENPEPVVIDYQETLQGNGLKINNPNITLSCGCGKSFG